MPGARDLLLPGGDGVAEEWPEDRHDLGRVLVLRVVAGLVDEDQLGFGDSRFELVLAFRREDEVVATGDDQGWDGDLPQPGGDGPPRQEGASGEHERLGMDS